MGNRVLGNTRFHRLREPDYQTRCMNVVTVE